MDYEIVELPARAVTGITDRASNNSPEEGAVIGRLWQRFMGEGLDRSIPGTQTSPYGCFALYHRYHFADMSYDLLVGCQTDAAEAPANMERAEIPAGRFAKLSIRGGDCVRSVQEAWEAIWADEELTAQRAFTVDFEAYLPGEDMGCADIDIFVALKADPSADGERESSDADDAGATDASGVASASEKGTVVAYLPERFADWEAGLACAEINRPNTGYRVRTMSVDGEARHSIGGLTVAVDLAADAADPLPDDTRMLVLVGGETWSDGSNDAVLRLVDDCVARNVPVAALCGACTFLAQHGYLDECDHTGNALFEFDQLAPAYRGHERFRCAPAVDGGAFITATGAASVEFAVLAMARLGVEPWGGADVWSAAFKRGTFVEE